MKTSKPKTKIITGCNDCPLCDRFFYDQIADCNAWPGDETIKLINDVPVTPNWCPLKIQPIIVTYES